MDLSTVRSAADSVFYDHVLGLNDPGNPLFRTVCVRRNSRAPLTQGVIAENVQLPGARVSVPRQGKVQPFETGSIRHKSKDDDVSCRAGALPLFGARATGYSRMDKTALLIENKTEDRDTCAGDSLLVDLPNVASKREKNSMKPLMRQKPKQRGQTRICPESTILVGTSALTTQIQGVVSEKCGGL